MGILGPILIAILLQMAWMVIVLLISYGLGYFFKLFWKTRASNRQRTALILIGLLDFGSTILWVVSDTELMRYAVPALLTKFFLYSATYKFLGESRDEDTSRNSKQEYQALSSVDGFISQSPLSRDEEVPPASPAEIKNINELEQNEPVEKSAKSIKQQGRLKRWFWASSAQSENSAQTVFRVLGNLLRATATVMFLFFATLITAAMIPAALSAAKDERPELFGSAHLQEWCDDEYHSTYRAHERAERICASRWAQYDRFEDECADAAELASNLLNTKCVFPSQPHYEKLNAKFSRGVGAMGISDRANIEVNRLIALLDRQLAGADLACTTYRNTSKLEARRCKLKTDEANKTDALLQVLRNDIVQAEAERKQYLAAMFQCAKLKGSKAKEFRDQVISAVKKADQVAVGLRIQNSCAAQAEEWAPYVYPLETQ